MKSPWMKEKNLPGLPFMRESSGRQIEMKALILFSLVMELYLQTENEMTSAGHTRERGVKERGRSEHPR